MGILYDDYPLQQYSQQMGMGNQSSMPSQPDDDFFVFRINGSDIIDEVKRQLRGEVLQADGSFKKEYDAWLNEEGISKIVHIMYCNGLNKNTLLGNLTKDEIYYKCRHLKKKLALLLFKRYRDFGIKKEMRDLIIQTVVNTVHSGLSRSEFGKEAKELSSATQRHEVYQHQEDSKDGIMGLLGIGGRKK
jgi:hypothetical protein